MEGKYNLRAVLSICSLSVLLSACGGGSSDGFSSTTDTGNSGSTTTTNPFNGASSKQIAQNLIQFLGLGFNENTKQFLSTPVYQGERTLSKARLSMLQKQTSIVENCELSGTLTWLTDDLNNNGAYDSGDSITLTHSQCRDSDNTKDGKEILVVNSYSGDETDANSDIVYSAKITQNITESAFNSCTQATQNVHEEGLINLSANITRPQINNSTSVRSSNYSKTVSEGNTSTTYRYTNMAVDITSNQSADAVLYEESSTLFVSGLGNLTIATITPFRYSLSNESAAPTQGVMLIKATDGSQIRLSATGNSTVTLETDSNGDGQFELSETLILSDLDNKPSC